MKTNLKKLSRGFTIVEVVIVLAIAGLILAIVLIAVPQLQRSARDNQRQNTVSRVKSEVETYASNNQGQYPFTAATWTSFYNRYITGGSINDRDPSTGNSIFGSSPSSTTPVSCGTNTVNNPCTPALPGSGIAKVVYGAKCNGESIVNAVGTINANPQYIHNYAIIMGLDRSQTFFCVDNG